MSERDCKSAAIRLREVLIAVESEVMLNGGIKELVDQVLHETEHLGRVQTSSAEEQQATVIELSISSESGAPAFRGIHDMVPWAKPSPRSVATVTFQWFGSAPPQEILILKARMRGPGVGKSDGSTEL